MLVARFAALILSLAVSGALAQGAWRFSNPKPHGNNIIELAVQDGVYWQVGDRGSVHTSRDLDGWTRHETGVQNSLRGLAFFQGKTYISGEAGLIISGTSPDGLSTLFLNTTNWLESIAASANALVAVGDNGSIYYSADGQTWTRKGNFSAWIRSIAYGDGQFLCVGEDGFAATSSDGQVWQQRAAPNVHLNRAVFINDRFWIVGEKGTVLTNTFRMVFNSINVGVTNHLYAVAGNSSDIVIAGDQVVLLGKPVGGFWAEQTDADNPILAPVWPYYSALWDGRLFLIGGRTGMKVEGYRTNATAPLQWFSDPQVTRSWLWSATRVGELYASVGSEGTIVTSLDGFSWTQEVVPSAAREEILLGIGGNHDNLVAVGSGGIVLRSPNILTNSVITNGSGQVQTNIVSLMGVIWNSTTAPTANDLQGIAANNTTYVISGAKGTILTSQNTTSWQPRLSGVTTYLSGVATTPSGFLVCGDDGVILHSADGTLWTRRNSRVTSWIYNVRHVGGKMIGVGEGGLIVTSDDGIQWTQRSSGMTEWINDVSYAPGRWFAVSTGGWIVTSTNAVNWTPAKSITSRSLYSVVSDGEQLIAVGIEGVILRNQAVAQMTPVNFLSYAASSQNSYFLFGGGLGQRFTLESRPNFSNGWQPEATLEITEQNGTLIHERTNLRESSRFFRTRLQTP